jgi:hypothetical protein
MVLDSLNDASKDSPWTEVDLERSLATQTRNRILLLEPTHYTCMPRRVGAYFERGKVDCIQVFTNSAINQMSNSVAHVG